MPFASARSSAWRSESDLTTLPEKHVDTNRIQVRSSPSLVMRKIDLHSLCVQMAIKLLPLISMHGMRGGVSMFHLDDNPLFRPKKSAKNRIPFDKEPHEHRLAQVCQQLAGRSKKHRTQASRIIKHLTNLRLAIAWWLPNACLCLLRCSLWSPFFGVCCGSVVGRTTGDGIG